MDRHEAIKPEEKGGGGGAQAAPERLRLASGNSFSAFTFLLCIPGFIWLVGYEYWNPEEDHGLGNLAKWLPYLTVAFGVLWITFVGMRWLACRASRRAITDCFIQFLRPVLLLSLFVLVVVNRSNERLVGGVGSETIVLLTGMTVSLALAVYREFLAPRNQWNAFALHLLVALVTVLSLAAFFHPDWSRWTRLYAYRDQVRWTGPFKNPNQFGLTMALGFVLISAAPILGGLRFSDLISPRNGTKRTRSLLVLLAAIVCWMALLFGLFKSYSRGAWLSTFLGILYLVMARRRICAAPNSPDQANDISPVRGTSRCWSSFPTIFSSRLNIFLLAVSISTVSFWCLRETDFRGIRRVMSVANPYDSSWRNRVDAYVGSLQIMADYPWRGLGWRKPETIYPEYYMRDRLQEGLAIVLNDYFTLGMSLGLPVLSCFIGYVLITVCERRPRRFVAGVSNRPIAGRGFFVQPVGTWPVATLARAGVIVLLTGFWFDRGLLLWSFGILFFLCLELSASHVSDAIEPVQSLAHIGDKTTMPGVAHDSPGHGLSECRHALLGFLLLALVGGSAMVWAKDRDPFQRVGFSLDIGAAKQCNGIVISPRPPAQYPLALYLYGAGNSLLSSGRQLRLIAKSGFAAASFECDQESQQSFNEQFAAVCHHLRNSNKTQTNLVWVTCGLSARNALKFALLHPDLQPDLLVCMDGAWTAEIYEALENLKSRLPAIGGENLQPGVSVRASSAIRCPILLVQSQEHSAVSQSDYERLAVLLRASGTSVGVCLLPESSLLSADALGNLRRVMQYAADRLPSPDYAVHLSAPGGISKTQAGQFNAALQKSGDNRDRIWRAISKIDEARRPEAMSFVAQLGDFELARLSPADLEQRFACDARRRGIGFGFTLLVFISLALWSCRYKFHSLRLWVRQPATRRSLLLTSVTGLMCIVALGLTGLNLLMPELKVNAFSLSIAESILFRAGAKEISFLGQQKTAGEVQLKILLRNVRLANLQRNQFYSRLPNDMFEPYILSPQIDSQSTAWESRKELWEYFQPRIRKQHDPLWGANIILDYLLERMGINASHADDQDADTIWLQKTTGQHGFRRIYVAALRSAGIAARLDESDRVEIWTGQAWTAAPEPPRLMFTERMSQTNSTARSEVAN